MTFGPKTIVCTLSLGGAGTFTGGASVGTAGLRQSVKIESVQGVTMTGAHVSIYGLPLSLMNQYSTIGPDYTEVGKNTISISTGENGSLSQIYTGAITTAFVDAQSQPEVAFRVESLSGVREAAMPVPPLTFSGSADVATIAQQMASAAGLQFENNGVNVKLSNPYFWGSARTQILNLCDHAGIQHLIENGKLAIWPVGGSRAGSVPLVSPETGMVGYPAFQSSLIFVTTLFNPAIQNGGQVQIQSQLTPACGLWSLVALSYDLSTVTPRGPWFQSFRAIPAKGLNPQNTTPTGSN